MNTVDHLVQNLESIVVQVSHVLLMIALRLKESFGMALVRLVQNMREMELMVPEQISSMNNTYQIVLIELKEQCPTKLSAVLKFVMARPKNYC